MSIFSSSTRRTKLYILAVLTVVLLVQYRIYFMDVFKTAQLPNSAMTMNQTITKEALIGIFTTAQNIERRSLLRSLYVPYKTNAEGPNMDVLFVVAKDEIEEYNSLIAMESETYRDIMILDIPENMNEGKSYHYFKHVAELYGNNGSELLDGARPYDFVIKTDDDSLLHLKHIEQRLSVTPKESTYWGTNCGNMDLKYMCGSGYALSWDIVLWTAQSDIPPAHQEGHEDMQVGIWFDHANLIKNYISESEIYDYGDRWDMGVWTSYSLNALIVHNLKENRALINSFGESLKDVDAMPADVYIDPIKIPYLNSLDHFALKIDDKCVDASFFYHLTLVDCVVGSPAQAFSHDADSRFVSYFRGTCLDVNQEQDPHLVELYECNDGENQKWHKQVKDSKIVSKWQPEDYQSEWVSNSLLTRDIENEAATSED